jgi:hypothetical protein
MKIAIARQNPTCQHTTQRSPRHSTRAALWQHSGSRGRGPRCTDLRTATKSRVGSRPCHWPGTPSRRNDCVELKKKNVRHSNRRLCTGVTSYGLANNHGLHASACSMNTGLLRVICCRTVRCMLAPSSMSKFATNRRSPLGLFPGQPDTRTSRPRWFTPTS